MWPVPGHCSARDQISSVLDTAATKCTGVHANTDTLITQSTFHTCSVCCTVMVSARSDARLQQYVCIIIRFSDLWLACLPEETARGPAPYYTATIAIGRARPGKLGTGKKEENMSGTTSNVNHKYLTSLELRLCCLLPLACYILYVFVL